MVSTQLRRRRQNSNQLLQPGMDNDETVLRRPINTRSNLVAEQDSVMLEFLRKDCVETRMGKAYEIYSDFLSTIQLDCRDMRFFRKVDV